MATDYIARYGNYLAEEKHASANTIASYLRDTIQFSEYLVSHEGCALTDVNSEKDPLLHGMDAASRKICCLGDPFSGSD